MVTPACRGRLDLRRDDRGLSQHGRPAHPRASPTSQAGRREQLTSEARPRTLADVLSFEEVGEDVFRAPAQGGEFPRLYGGLIVAQALGAVARTVEPERRAHSLHCYFLRMGSQRLPVDYTVERTRDGRSYSSRRVVASQEGSVIFTMSASFHGDEEGLEHQVAMPVTPGHEGLRPMGEVLRFPGAGSTFDLIEVRMPPSFAAREPTADPEEHRQLWFRSAAPLGDAPSEQECLLGFASDLMPSSSVLSRHAIPPTKRTETASLDHSVWFHRPFRADRWLCYDQVSPVASGGRGWFNGRIFTEDGALVATVAQEVQLRVRERDEASQFLT